MLVLQGYLTGFSSRHDRSAGVRFTTQELTGETMAQLQNLNGSFGHILFQENKFADADLPTEQAEDKSKTPSKRQRGLLFLIWKRDGSKGDFEVFYRARMERNIERLKIELDETI